MPLTIIFGAFTSNGHFGCFTQGEESDEFIHWAVVVTLS